MAVNEIYIDVSSGSDMMGDGSTTFPYATLSYAFATHGALTNGVRYNIKGTSSGSPHTATGTLPTGHSSKPVYVGGYTTAAGDGTQAYLSGGGSMIWDDPTNDDISFVNITFQDYGSGYAFDLDNLSSCYSCIFDSDDGGGCNADSECVFVNCEFKNLAASAHGSTSSMFYFCTFSWTGTADHNSFVTSGRHFFNCRFYIPDASVDLVIRNSTYNTGVIAGNSIYMTTGGAADEIAIDVTTFHSVINNYVEGAAVGIDNSGRGAYIRDNVFFDCTTDVSTASSSINLAEADVNTISLASSGLPDISAADFTPSADLRDAAAGLTESGSTTGIKQQLGGVLNFPDSSSGLSYTPKLRGF